MRPVVPRVGTPNRARTSQSRQLRWLLRFVRTRKSTMRPEHLRLAHRNRNGAALQSEETSRCCVLDHTEDGSQIARERVMGRVGERGRLDEDEFVRRQEREDVPVARPALPELRVKKRAVRREELRVHLERGVRANARLRRDALDLPNVVHEDARELPRVGRVEDAPKTLDTARERCLRHD